MSSDNRRLCILDAVRSLFSRKGLGVTSRELAQASGVSEALIYKLFESKEKLFSALLQECVNNYTSIAQKLLQHKPSTEVLCCATYIVVHAFVYGIQNPKNSFSLTPEETRGLLLQSLQTDGDFARNMFNQGLGPYAPAFIEAMRASEKNGDLAPSSIPFDKLVWYVHHFCLGTKFTLHPKPHAFMMARPTDEELSEDLWVFSLRGMGVTQTAIERVQSSSFFKEFRQNLIINNQPPLQNNKGAQP